MLKKSGVSNKSSERENLRLSDANQTTVYLKVVVLKVGEVETVKEQFKADVFIQASWNEARKDRNTMNGSVEPSLYWDPKIEIQNTIGEGKKTEWTCVEAISNSHCNVIKNIRIAGDFSENMELQEFPFDTQELSLKLRSELNENEVKFEEHPKEISSVNFQSFVDAQEWRLYNHVETTSITQTNPYTVSSQCHPIFLVQFRASRRPGFFLWNIFLITFLISSLCFATFSVSTKLPQNRLQLSYTLVLTSVAFKFVVNQSLPKISYLTYLDKYILGCMLFLYLICIWHAAISVFTITGENYNIEDKIAFGILISLYLLFHIVFGILIFFNVFKKRRLMARKDEDYNFKARRKNAKRDEMGLKNVLSVSPIT